MLEIGAVSSDNTNLTTRDINALSRSGGDSVQTVEMTFGDLLDMINPLQHIPGISSIYRAIANEEINPVSRIAGDALYGGAFGIASAGIGALCAIGDEAIAANNNGQSATDVIVTALLGDGKDDPVQVAAAKNKPETEAIAVAPTVAAAPTAAPAIESMRTASNEVAPAAHGMPLDRAKLPYGGVMDTAMMANAQQNQALALAMVSQRNALQAQRSIHSSRLSSATAPSAQTAASTETSTAATDITSKATPETQAAMQKLLQDLQAMKAINQYQSAAQASPKPGTSAIDTIN